MFSLVVQGNSVADRMDSFGVGLAHGNIECVVIGNIVIIYAKLAGYIRVIVS